MIKINKTLLKKLGIEDYREFAELLGNWANRNDFTYKDSLYDPEQGATWQKFLKEVIKSILKNDYD